MYDFDKLTNRYNTHSLKWDVIEENELPMWVADMDFETAPEIIEDLHKRVDHGIFGYNIDDEDYFKAIQSWWYDEHHFKIEREWMMFCTGVVPAISSIVRRVTQVGENVVILSPTYNIFYNSIINNGRHILSSDLIYDGQEYSIDYADLEKKLSHPETTLLIFCNPQNPIGKIWDKETLENIGQLCKKHHVIVLSDEIHCDIVRPGMEYIPFASVNETNRDISITCVAPTKCFNIAGLQSSCIIVANEPLRHKVNRGINTDEVAEGNTFAQIAGISAFTKGKQWLKELNCYIQKNKDYATQYIQKELPLLYVIPSDATYLLWIDCSKYCDNTDILCEFIRKETGLFIIPGEEYGDNGKTFVRVNVACPMSRLQDGMQRLKTGLDMYESRR